MEETSTTQAKSIFCHLLHCPPHVFISLFFSSTSAFLRHHVSVALLLGWVMLLFVSCFTVVNQNVYSKRCFCAWLWLWNMDHKEMRSETVGDIWKWTAEKQLKTSNTNVAQTWPCCQRHMDLPKTRGLAKDTQTCRRHSNLLLKTHLTKVNSWKQETLVKYDQDSSTPTEQHDDDDVPGKKEQCQWVYGWTTSTGKHPWKGDESTRNTCTEPV